MTTETPLARVKLYAERQRAYPKVADFMSDLRTLVAGHEAKDAALQAAAQRFREYEASNFEAAWDGDRERFAKRHREMAELCEKALGIEAPTPKPTGDAPEPPWPPGYPNNAKREGWSAFFAGQSRGVSPFPPIRSDLHDGYREGWDHAQAYKEGKT